MLDPQTAQQAVETAKGAGGAWSWPAVIVLLISSVGLWIDKVGTVIRARQARRKFELTATAMPQTQAPAAGNGKPNSLCLKHVEDIAGLKENWKQFETFRKENREDHQKIFDAINGRGPTA